MGLGMGLGGFDVDEPGLCVGFRESITFGWETERGVDRCLSGGILEYSPV